MEAVKQWCDGIEQADSPLQRSGEVIKRPAAGLPREPQDAGTANEGVPSSQWSGRGVKRGAISMGCGHVQNITRMQKACTNQNAREELAADFVAVSNITLCVPT